MLRATNKKYFWDLTYISIFWDPIDVYEKYNVSDTYWNKSELVQLIQSEKWADDLDKNQHLEQRQKVNNLEYDLLNI
ncbi:unnamed protein product [Rhizophagus irregularis]|nr:unnamed protein product [Rhizophagus irregularis]